MHQMFVSPFASQKTSVVPSIPHPPSSESLSDFGFAFTIRVPLSSTAIYYYHCKQRSKNRRGREMEGGGGGGGGGRVMAWNEAIGQCGSLCIPCYPLTC